MRNVLLLMLFLGSALYLVLGDTSDPVGAALATGGLVSVAILAVDRIHPDPRRWAVVLVGHVHCRRKLVRVSIAYLFRIKLGDAYLLVESARRPGQFQPVGGAYKRFAETTPFFASLGMQDDDCIPIDDSSANDLRLRVPGRKLGQLLTWFDSGDGRELSPWREFHEELVKPGILQSKTFPYVFYRRIGRRMTTIRWSEDYGRHEFRMAEIFELIPTAEQDAALRAVKAGAGLRWANRDEIERRGVVPKKRLVPTIADITMWTL